MSKRRLMTGVLWCALALGPVGVPAQQVPAPLPPTDPGRRPSRIALSWRDDPARSQAVTWRTNAPVGEAFAVDVADRLQSLTTTYDAAVELIRGRASQPGGEIGRSSGA